MNRRELFEVLIRENSGMLWSFLRALVRPAEAEDHFQQTCLVAWKTLERYDRQRPFGPWLRGIAANVVLEARRRLRKEAPVDPTVLAELEAHFEKLGAAPGDTWPEKLNALVGCLWGLSEDARRLIDLYYRDGLTCGEIAVRESENVENVKKKLQRIREQLLLCMTPKLGEALS
jgi:RNA polymerase sigma-70 factor (ECF subfamily)